MVQSDKEGLEVEKIKREIEKIKEDVKVAKGTNKRFFWGSICVPLGVAIGTYLVIHSTGYFNAWQMKNEIAETRFKEDTTKWQKAKDSILIRIDSLSHQGDLLKRENTQLKAIVNTQKENSAYYQKLIDEGPSKDKQVNILIKQNDSLKRQMTHLNIELGDKDEKMNFVRSLATEAIGVNRLLSDSIAKIQANDLAKLRESAQYWDRRNEEQVGTIAFLKGENKILTDSLAKLNKRLGN